MTEDDVDAVHDWMSDPEVVRYQLYDCLLYTSRCV